MKNIIIPVDFSKHSEYALKTGAILAKKHDATLHILHMLELSDSLISHSSEQNTNEMMFLLALSKKKLEPFLDKDYLDGIDIKAIIKHNKVYKEVDILARELQADLIIMGSHGLMAHEGIFAGSNAEKMVRNSTTPVLTVKSDPSQFKLNKIAYATDLSKESAITYKKAMELLTDIAGAVHLVYVNRPHTNFLSSQEFKEQLKEFTAAGGAQEVAFVAAYTIEEGLMEYAQDIKADCVVVSTHARKGLSHFFKGSVSEDLANSSHLPVMSFKMS